MKKLNVAATNPIVSSPRKDLTEKLSRMLAATEREARRLEKLADGIESIMDAKWALVDAPETNGESDAGLNIALQQMEKRFQSMKKIMDARIIEAAGDVEAYLILVGCPANLRPECEGYYTEKYINKMTNIANRDY